METEMNYEPTPVAPASSAWVAFSYIGFGVAILMICAGLYFVPMEPMAKAYFGMASVLLIQACITLTKTLRDDHESKRLINRLDHVKTEKLLSDAASR
jgi:hypothetical protein